MSALFFSSAAGFSGSLPCLSTCGPLVLANSMQARGPQGLAVGPVCRPLPAGFIPCRLSWAVIAKAAAEQGISNFEDMLLLRFGVPWSIFSF